MTLRIYWVPSPKFTRGHPAKLIALVHHRMVGTLAGTDITFTTGTRVASTNFGVGYGCGKDGHPETDAHVHQYVRLGDQAWGNGNWDATGSWDGRYPTTYLNSRTISIEHHDNGGRAPGDGKGVVPEKVLAASIELDRLLLRGDVAEMKAAGIRFNDTYASAIGRELRAITPGRNTIIDHHYISGRLKPSCWRPWADDKVGFPQARYLDSLSDPTIPDTSTGDTVKSFPVPEKPTLATIRDKAWLYADSSLATDPANVQISPGRDLGYVGVLSADVRIVAYEPSAGDTNGSSTAMFVREADILGYKTAPATDCTAAVKAATDPLNAKIAALTAQLEAAKAASTTAATTERERIAAAEAARIRAL